ncbi:hypothetical protein D3C87_1708800 [compost metagenome]
MKADSAFRHRPDEGVAQLVGPITVHGHVHADSAPRRGDQRALDILAHGVVKEDEGLHQHLAPRGLDGLDHGGKILGAVFKQGVAVVFAPAQIHNAISAQIGTWSDRRDQTREASGTGCQSRTLRT